MTESNKYYDKLSKLPSKEVLQILYDCIDILAPVSLKQCAEMECVTKPVIIDRIKQGKLKALHLEGRDYPLINYRN